MCAGCSRAPESNSAAHGSASAPLPPVNRVSTKGAPDSQSACRSEPRSPGTYFANPPVAARLFHTEIAGAPSVPHAVFSGYGFGSTNQQHSGDDGEHEADDVELPDAAGAEGLSDEAPDK
jgi:hypothetical protein